MVELAANLHMWKLPQCPKKVNIFRDINPEACSDTAFEKREHMAGGGERLTELGLFTEETKIKVLKTILPQTSLIHKSNDTEKLIGPLNSMANPKGVRTRCEVCRGSAKLVCLKCGVTFYCSMSHVKEDLLHDTACLKLCLIRTELDITAQHISVHRILGLKSLVSCKMLEETFQNAVKNLYAVRIRQQRYHSALFIKGAVQASITDQIQGKVDFAVTGFQRCTPLFLKTFGIDTCEAVTCLIFTSNAYLCMKDRTMAINSMSSAMIKLKECTTVRGDNYPYTKALLCQAQGNLDMYEKRYVDAVFHFSDCVYFTTERFGPTHVRVCSGYLCLAKAFMALGRGDDADSLVDFCLDIWRHNLEELFLASLPTRDIAPIILKNARTINDFSLFLQLEAYEQLQEIASYIGLDLSMLVKTYLCLAMLHILKESFADARRCMEIVGESIAEVDNAKLKKLAKKIRRHLAKLRGPKKIR